MRKLVSKLSMIWRASYPHANCRTSQSIEMFLVVKGNRSQTFFVFNSSPLTTREGWVGGGGKYRRQRPQILAQCTRQTYIGAGLIWHFDLRSILTRDRLITVIEAGSTPSHRPEGRRDQNSLECKIMLRWQFLTVSHQTVGSQGWDLCPFTDRLGNLQSDVYSVLQYNIANMHFNVFKGMDFGFKYHAWIFEKIC